MKLYEWRLRRVLTQKDLAAKAGIATETVTSIERGIQLPTMGTALKLADALGIEPTEIDEVQQAIERSLAKKEPARVLA